MSDPLIIRDVQLTTSDSLSSSPVSALRQTQTFDSNDTYNSAAPQLNVTIVLTSPTFPNRPQLGRIRLPVALRVDSFVVYYKTSAATGGWRAFNSDPAMAGIATVFSVDESAIFPDQFFTDEVIVVLNKAVSDVITVDDVMSVKIDLFACFTQGG